jgi:hypothetical protein
MSWISVVGRDIGKVLKVIVGVATSPEGEKLIGSIPVYGPIAETIFGAIADVEGLLPSSNGALKKTMAMAIVNSKMPTEITTPATGSQLSGPLDQAKLSDKIDKIVAVLNALDAELKAIG